MLYGKGYAVADRKCIPYYLIVEIGECGMKAKTPGVSFYKRTGKWKAEINRKGERIHIGYYASKNEAADARALWEQDNPAPVEPKRTKPVLQTADEVMRSVDFGEPATPRRVAKPAQPDPFELRYNRNKVMGPDNYDLNVLVYPDVWAEIVRDGWVDKWLAAGDWWRFHRYGKLDVWDAEVSRIAEACAVKLSVANLILRHGLRDDALVDPAQAEKLAKLADPAQALGVADLV